MFCNHEWDIVDYKKIPSEFERVIQFGFTPKTDNDLTEKHVWILKCKKCPKIKKIVEIN